MVRFAELRSPARAYVSAVVLAGAAAVAHSTYRLLLDPPGTQWVVIAALTLLTGSFSVKVASINARISVSETFVFVAVLLFGTPAGTITVLLEALIVIFWMSPVGRPFHRLVFNLAAPAIAIWLAATVFFLFPGIEPYSLHSTPLADLLLPLTAFTALYFLLNSWLVAIAVGLENQQSAAVIWWTRFTWLAVNYFSGASVAALIVTYMRELTPSALLIVVPFLVVSYLTFQTAMGRVEDSNKHLSELNRLYLSTIETLAMAIDAKDQITHGHIRRVQGYAVGLAKHVGVTDDKLIKAIEAAALLHDMGKLAVPEYILNKPGKLTGAEFEKMKLHSSVGADILSAIDFPYPVVPIVRHHHENWDGSGYPSGLKGTDIPIGARILAVVDCFDALTSDRPYRPRLADGEAMHILLERRGKMYDPLVVDTFSRVHGEIAPDIIANLPGNALYEITSSTQLREMFNSSPPLENIAAGADEMLTLYELARTLAGQSSVSDTGDIISKHLRRLVPFALSVLYQYDDASDELVARHASGDVAGLTSDLRVPLGQRLSGWVAANRQTILNSDPALDFGDVARTYSPRLRSCLSCPLMLGDQLIGVLTLYSSQTEGFTEDHRRIVEVVARQAVQALKSAFEIGHKAYKDALTGLPNQIRLEELLRHQERDSGGLLRERVLIFLEITNLREIIERQGSATSDDVLRQVALCSKPHLRSGDLLFRCAVNQFVALMKGADLRGARDISEQIRSGIASHPFVSRGAGTVDVQLAIACVPVALDEHSFKHLLDTAYVQLASQQRDPPSQVH